MGSEENTIQRYDSPDEKTVNRKLIEDSVEFINAKANETLYKGSLEIGNYILKHFFNDDIELASSKNPRKPNSYKALCRHKELSVPYSTLTIMVRVAAQERFLVKNNIDTDKIGYTHKATLIRLENDDEKIYLAKKCLNENLSSRKLSEIVKKSHGRLSDDRKKNQDETAFRNIVKLEQLIGRSEKSGLVTDISKMRSMKTKTRQDLREKATELLEIMAQTTKDCKKILKNLEKVEKEKSV